MTDNKWLLRLRVFNNFSANRECKELFQKSEATGQLALLNSSPKLFYLGDQKVCLKMIF